MKFSSQELYDICECSTNRLHGNMTASWDYGRMHNLPLFVEFISKLELYHQEWYFEHKPPHICAFEIPLRGTLLIDHADQRITVSPGEIYFLPAGEYNRLAINDSDHLRKVSIGFSGNCFSSFANSLFGNRRLFPVAPILPQLLERLGELLKMLEAKKPAQLSDLVAGGAWFLMALAGCIDRSVPPRLSNAIRLFEFNFGDPLCIDKTAFALKISKYQLTVLFKQHLQISPKQYLIELRMRKAAEFLQNNHMLVKEVARQTGYASPRIFARVFHKFYGSSPQNLRLQ